MKVPALIETAFERTADVLIVDSPAAMDGFAIADGQDIGRAVGHWRRGGGAVDLHQRTGEIAGRMKQVLVWRGDSERGSVIVSSEMSARAYRACRFDQLG